MATIIVVTYVDNGYSVITSDSQTLTKNLLALQKELEKIGISHEIANFKIANFLAEHFQNTCRNDLCYRYKSKVTLFNDCFLKLLNRVENKIKTIDNQNIAILTEWANSYGYEFHTHKNGAFEHDVYNCYLRKPDMPNDKCVKAFLYGSEFEAVEAASKWLYNTYKKIKTYPVLIEKVS